MSKIEDVFWQVARPTGGDPITVGFHEISAFSHFIFFFVTNSWANKAQTYSAF